MNEKNWMGERNSQAEKSMAERIYFAPMEGITGYVFRNAHHACFPAADRYYTPFITPKKGKSFTQRELNDVLPEHNQGMEVVPQILTNQAEGFLKVANMLADMGYTEVNLNLGCPFGTVVAKNKGAGFLALPGELDAFLEQIFTEAEVKISVKTRIGKEDPEEFAQLLSIFNKYPIAELIIHPRVQTDFYKNTPNLKVFGQALVESKNPVCYNGDLFCLEKVQKLLQQFPQTKSIMLGRGLLMNPALAQAVRQNILNGDGGQTAQPPVHVLPDRAKLTEFLAQLENGYSEVLSGERDVLFKMKELWSYLGFLFAENEKYIKKIRKSQHLSEYRAAVKAIFTECEMTEPKQL